MIVEYIIFKSDILILRVDISKYILNAESPKYVSSSDEFIYLDIEL